MERVLEKSGRFGRSAASMSCGNIAIQVFEPNMKVSAENFPGKLFQVTSEDKSKFSMKRYTIGITNTQIIELVSDKYNPAYMTTLDCHAMESLVKVKFKRGSVITFHFRSGVLKKFFMFDCVECVSTIKNIMSQSGKSATHSSRKHSLNVANAQSLLEIVRNLEDQFSIKPSHALVTTLMDHLREAVECFGEANDPRYQEVIAHIQSFLQRADVIAILDPPPPKPPSIVSSGSIIEAPDPGTGSNGTEPLSTGGVPGRVKKEVSQEVFDASSAALARDLAAMMQSWSEDDVDDGELDVDAEETVGGLAFQDLQAAMSAVPTDTGPLMSRSAKRDTIELNELNDMLGNMSAELESIVGHSTSQRRLSIASRASSMGSYDAEFEAFLSSLEHEDEAEVTYDS